MQRNVKLTTCGILEVGMAERSKFIGFGAVRASRSPSSNMLANILDPVVGPGLYSQDTTGKPTVKINVIKDQVVTPQTTFACTVGTKAIPTQTSFTIDKYLQDGLAYEVKEFSDLCENAEAYLAGLSSNVSINGGTETMGALRKFRALGSLQDNIQRRLKTAFLAPMEQYALQKLVAGYNPLTQQITAKVINLKDAAGHYVEDILTEMVQLKLTTGYADNYIAIGGIKWATWFSASCGMPNIHCCSDIGTNFQTVRDSMPFEFYFSNYVDAMYGEGTLILIEKESFAGLTFAQNQFMPNSFAENEFGSLSVRLAENCENSFILPLETFSNKKGMCPTSGKPQIELYWQLTYDFWTKPFNFLEGATPLSGDTGIYHYVLGQ